MNVGLLQIVLQIPDAQNLKDKRRILRGLLDQIKAKFEVAAAEIDDQDAWQSSVVGFATVSNDRRLAAQVMDRVLAFVRESPAARVVEHELETL